MSIFIRSSLSNLLGFGVESAVAAQFHGTADGSEGLRGDELRRELAGNPGQRTVEKPLEELLARHRIGDQVRRDGGATHSGDERIAPTAALFESGVKIGRKSGASQDIPQVGCGEISRVKRTA